MEVIQNQFLFGEKEENRVKLESLEISDLFLVTKKVTRDLMNANFSQNNAQQKKLLIKKIIELIVSNIQSSSKMNSKKFASLFSIFSYVNVVLHCEPICIKLQNAFYQNIGFYAQKILQQWTNGSDSSLQAPLRINLSTLLCSFTSLISESKRNVLSVNIDKLFSIQLVKNLMQTKFPNEEKFMKHYIFLIRYVSKIKMIGVSKELYVKSLFHHLSSFSASKVNQISIINNLNKILEQKKLFMKLSQLVSVEKISEILKISFKLLAAEEQQDQIKLLLSFNLKLTDKLQDEKILSGEEFIKIYLHLFKNKRIFQKLESSIQQILSKMDQESQYFIFKEFTKIQSLSTIEFEIIQICTKNMQDEFFFEIMETGYWQNLIKIFEEEKNMSYKKYLLTKIFNNIIQNSKRNQDLYETLRNIYFHRRIYFLSGIFQ